MLPLDLSQVDPRKWNSVRKRYGLVVEFERQRRTGKVSEDLCAQIDGGAKKIQSISRRYRYRRDPNTLIDGRRKRRPSKRGKALRLDPRSITILDTLIDNEGSLLTATEIRRRAVNKCRRAKLSQPTLGHVRARLKARSSRLEIIPDRDALFVQSCFLGMPVKLGAKVVIPTALFAISLANGEIIAWRFSTNGAQIDPDPEFLAEIAERPEASILASATAPFVRHLKGLEKPIIRRAVHGAVLHDVIGASVGLIAVLRSPPKRVERYLPSKFDSPVSAEDAQVAMSLAVSAHNQAVYASFGQ